MPWSADAPFDPLVMLRDEGRTILVDESPTECFARTTGSRSQRTVGSLTDDAPKNARGKAKQTIGEARTMYGPIVDHVRNFTADQPFAALLAATGLGVVMGFLVTRH